MANTTAAITNQLDIDVEIFDVYNTSKDSKNPKVKYTSLGKVAAGKTANIATIHFSSQLQAMVTGEIKNLQAKYYYQFPVSVFAITPLGNKTDHTISKDEQSGMEQAFQFIKYSSANGNSKLTQDFLSALKNSDDQMGAVNNFFASTGSFKLCTFSAWTAVMAYQTHFTSPWQGGYYFYTRPKTANDPVKLMAIAVITSTASQNDAIMTMANSDNTIPANNAETTPLALADDGTFTEENVGSGNISVSMHGIWMNVITTDAKTKNTKYLIGPAFSGTINGVDVVATQQMRELPKSQANSMSEQQKKAAEAEKEKQFDRMWSKVIGVIGILSSLGMLFVMMKQMKKESTQKKLDVENDAAEKGKVDESQVEVDQQQIDKQYNSEVNSELSPEIEKVSTDVEVLPQAESDLATAEKYNATESMLDTQIENLSSTLESQAPTDSLEQTAENLYDAQTKLESGDIVGATTELVTTSTQVDKALSDSSATAEQYETDALTEVQQGLQENADVSESVDNAQAEQQSQNESDPSEALDSDSFDAPSSDPIDDFPIGGGE